MQSQLKHYKYMGEVKDNWYSMGFGQGLSIQMVMCLSYYPNIFWKRCTRFGPHILHCSTVGSNFLHQPLLGNFLYFFNPFLFQSLWNIQYVLLGWAKKNEADTKLGSVCAITIEVSISHFRSDCPIRLQLRLCIMVLRKQWITVKHIDPHISTGNVSS